MTPFTSYLTSPFALRSRLQIGVELRSIGYRLEVRDRSNEGFELFYAHRCLNFLLILRQTPRRRIYFLLSLKLLLAQLHLLFCIYICHNIIIIYNHILRYAA